MGICPAFGRGTLPREWAMLPSAEALHLRRVRRNLFAAVCEQDFAGNRNPQGGGAEAEERVAAGRMRSPERCPNQGRSKASENTGTRTNLPRLAGEEVDCASVSNACPKPIPEVRSILTVKSGSGQALGGPASHRRERNQKRNWRRQNACSSPESSVAGFLRPQPGARKDAALGAP